MKFFLHFKITFLMISSLIPWPKLNQPSPSCSREFSFIVRKFVEKKWGPIYSRFKVDIPLSCPLSPERDMFHAFHRSKFPVEPKKWSCGLCGKSFHNELSLDLHLLRKHSDHLHLVEDSICPAEFCDLIRCEVLQFAELSQSRKNNNSEDEEPFRNSRERQQTITALVKATPQVTPMGHHHRQSSGCLSDVEHCRRKGWLMVPSSGDSSASQHCCLTSDKPTEVNQTEDSPCRNGTGSSDSIHSAGDYPLPSSKEAELSERIKQKKSACRDEDFAQLRSECARLIDLCTSGLILRMTNQQFHHLRDDLNRSVCWHLQCDRYWNEVVQPDPATSSLLLICVSFALVGFASSYVIVCIVCQEPRSFRPPSSSGRMRSTSQPQQQYNNGGAEWDSQAVQKRPASSRYYSGRSNRSSYVQPDMDEENSLI